MKFLAKIGVHAVLVGLLMPMAGMGMQDLGMMDDEDQAPLVKKLEAQLAAAGKTGNYEPVQDTIIDIFSVNVSQIQRDRGQTIVKYTQDRARVLVSKITNGRVKDNLQVIMFQMNQDTKSKEVEQKEKEHKKHAERERKEREQKIKTQSQQISVAHPVSAQRPQSVAAQSRRIAQLPPEFRDKHFIGLGDSQYIEEIVYLEPQELTQSHPAVIQSEGEQLLPAQHPAQQHSFTRFFTSKWKSILACTAILALGAWWWFKK